MAVKIQRTHAARCVFNNNDTEAIEEFMIQQKKFQH